MTPYAIESVHDQGGQPPFNKANFRVHLKRNPEVYELFVELALKATKIRKYFSARAILHAMRWEKQIIALEEEGFKVNQGWGAFYSRKFIKDYPQHLGFFEMRIYPNSCFNNPKDIAFAKRNNEQYCERTAVRRAAIKARRDAAKQK